MAGWEWGRTAGWEWVGTEWVGWAGTGWGAWGEWVGVPGGMDGMSLSQRMETGTAATFQVIQSIVGAFGGFAQMLEATFMAVRPTLSSLFLRSGATG